MVLIFPQWGQETVTRLMGGLWQAIQQGFETAAQRRARVRSVAQFRAFLEGEAAHLAQSATYDYLRARTGLMGPQLFREKTFLDALEVTRWEALAAVLADLMVIAQNELRPHMADSADLSVKLAAFYSAALASHPSPSHRPDGWRSHEAAVMPRLIAARNAPPETAAAVAGHSGEVIFQYLPLHPDVRRLDQEMVVNNVRFRMIRTWEIFKARVDCAAVAAELAASGHPV